MKIQNFLDALLFDILWYNFNIMKSVYWCVIFAVFCCNVIALHPAQNWTRELPGLHYCVAKISRRYHRIAVEILPSTGTNHATRKSNS